MAENVADGNSALRDLANGWARHRLWLTLARDDVRMRYRRSVLGPLWLTLGTGFFILVLSALWIEILGRQADELIPWVAVGLTVWQLISAIVIEGTATFTLAASIIHNIPMPLSVHVYRTVMRHLINYFHNFLIVIVVFVVFPPNFGAVTLLFIPGLLIITLAAIACSIILGILGARYRDFSYAIRTLMGPVFFLTPILWIPDMLSGNRAILAELNPFTHFLAIVREPLLGRVPSHLTYAVALGITLILTGLALRLLSKHRAKVPYWVS